MTLTTNNSLTPPQIRTLDRIEEQDPEAIVTGWDESFNGPRIQPTKGNAFTISPIGSRTHRAYNKRKK